MDSQTPHHTCGRNHAKNRDKTRAGSHIYAGQQPQGKCLTPSDNSSFSKVNTSPSTANTIYSGQTTEKSNRKLLKCSSPQTPRLLSYSSFADCDSVLDGSVSRSSNRSSLYSANASPVPASPSCPHAPCYVPAHTRISHIQSQPSSPCMRNHRTRYFKPVIHTHREEQRSAVKTRGIAECENESSLGCCSFGETKSRPQPQLQLKPVLSTYFTGFMSWMSKGTNAIMDVLPSSSKEDFHLVMIGLDGAGKTTALYRMKLDQYLNTVPTIGFNCERVAGTVGRSAGLTFLVWDVSGQDKIRPLWRSYTRSTDGIIFVLDSADYRTLDEARLELHRAVHYQDNVDIPLLVLANKQDLPRAFGEEEVIKALGLRSLNNVLWSVQLGCSITGLGLGTGIEMMHMMIMKKKMISKRKRNQTQ